MRGSSIATVACAVLMTPPCDAPSRAPSRRRGARRYRSSRPGWTGAGAVRGDRPAPWRIRPACRRRVRWQRPARVACGRGVRAYAGNAAVPLGRLGPDRDCDVARMRAVDQEVVRRCGLVYRRDRLRQADATQQTSVGVDCERHCDRHPFGSGGAHDADGLTDVSDGVGGGQVRSTVGERGQLRAVIVEGGVRVRFRGRGVPVVTRPDAPADADDSDFADVVAAQVGHELDRRRVHPFEIAGVVAQESAPVRVGAPGGALQQQRAPTGRRNRGISRVVVAQRRTALGRVQQHEGREVGQVHAAAEDQVGLNAAVGDEHPGALVHCAPPPRRLASPRARGFRVRTGAGFRR